MNSPITLKDIEKSQKDWGQGIIDIGLAFLNKKDYYSLALKQVNEYYAYDISNVLFKPTKAVQNQFRHTKEEALSYFIGKNNECSEDLGFALQPWKEIRFENNDFIINDKQAICMGNYYFRDYNGLEIKVEYTFGYIKDATGKMRINLHHSSIPFTPPTEAQQNFIREYRDLIL